VRRAVLAFLALAIVPVGCSEPPRPASPGERMAFDLAREIQYVSGAAADVNCSRLRPRDFSCRAYRPRTATVAVQATYAVHRCERGGWRGRKRKGAKIFPRALRFDDPKTEPSPDCGG
jgi:hypothetical protein